MFCRALALFLCVCLCVLCCVVYALFALMCDCVCCVCCLCCGMVRPVLLLFCGLLVDWSVLSAWLCVCSFLSFV